MLKQSQVYHQAMEKSTELLSLERFFIACLKKISVREKMTDDNKTPTDDKITELSAWQKKQRIFEALEKREKKQRKLKAKKQKEDEDLQKRNSSVSEEESDERKESEEEDESET